MWENKGSYTYNWTHNYKFRVQYYLKWISFALWVVYTARPESRCALTKGVGSDVHERLYKFELNWTIKHCTGIALQPLFNNWTWTNSTIQGNFDTDNQIYVP
jgi:hypothetical protein